MGRDEAGSARTLRIPVRFTRKSELTRPERPGNVARVASKEIERSTRKRVRSLRTQQRTDNQCQFFNWCCAGHFITPWWVSGWILIESVWLVWSPGCFCGLLIMCCALFGCGAGYMHSMESLI